MSKITHTKTGCKSGRCDTCGTCMSCGEIKFMKTKKQREECKHGKRKKAELYSTPDSQAKAVTAKAAKRASAPPAPVKKQSLVELAKKIDNETPSPSKNDKAQPTEDSKLEKLREIMNILDIKEKAFTPLGESLANQTSPIRLKECDRDTQQETITFLKKVFKQIFLLIFSLENTKKKGGDHAEFDEILEFLISDYPSLLSSQIAKDTLSGMCELYQAHGTPEHEEKLKNLESSMEKFITSINQ